MNQSYVLLVLVLAGILLFALTKGKKEGFNPPRDSVYNACGSPCSVLPPQWIGRLDQGNGLLGDDHLSGFAFYDAM